LRDERIIDPEIINFETKEEAVFSLGAFLFTGHLANCKFIYSSHFKSTEETFVKIEAVVERDTPKRVKHSFN